LFCEGIKILIDIINSILPLNPDWNVTSKIIPNTYIIISNGWRSSSKEHDVLPDEMIGPYKHLAYRLRTLIQESREYEYQFSRQAEATVWSEKELFDLWEEVLVLDERPLSRFRFHMVLRICTREGWWF
jgi:hypothetical protein